MQLSRRIKNISPQKRERERERKRERRTSISLVTFHVYTSSSNNVGDPITGPKRGREREGKKSETRESE